MKKNILEEITPDGNIFRLVEEKTGIPSKYVLGAAVGILALAWLTKKSGGGGTSFFGRYVTPLIVAGIGNELFSASKKKNEKKAEEQLQTQGAF